MSNTGLTHIPDTKPLRVLIAEDEFLVGSILEENLQDSGYEVVGVLDSLPSLEEAVRTLNFDLAILDVNLAGQMVYPVAEELRARGMPFILVTGYGARSLPDNLKDARILPKPCAFSEIEKSMLRVWQAKARGPVLVDSEKVKAENYGSHVATEKPLLLGDVLRGALAQTPAESEWVDLVKSVAGGDQLALHSLYERANRMVFTLAVRITANPETAEEVTLDVFHDVWRRAANYDTADGTVLGWIMNQARSRAIDRLRFENRKKRRHVDDLNVAESFADPEDVIVFRDQCQSLKAAINTLNLAERQAIEITFFGGFTHSEAAKKLNEPLGTIKTRIRSGLHKLRDALADETRQS